MRQLYFVVLKTNKNNSFPDSYDIQSTVKAGGQLKKKHHKNYVKHFTKGRFAMPKKSLPDTPDLEAMMEDIPEKSSKAFLITLRSNRWVHVENYSNIADYKENRIKIMGKQHLIIIEGKGLSIIYFTEDDILVSGIIQSVRYV